MNTPAENEARDATITLDGWAGRVTQPVKVIGETPKRYRITAEKKIHLAGRCRTLSPGETALVPKYTVTFAKAQGGPK